MLHTNAYPRPISTLAAPDAILGRLLASLYEVSFWLLIALAILIPARAQRKADLSSLVVVGDSLSAGFQNGSLMDSQQPNGYASLVAAQAGVPLPLPLIA